MTSSHLSFSKKIRSLAAAGASLGAAIASEAAIVSQQYDNLIPHETNAHQLAFDPFTGATYTASQFTPPTNYVSLFSCGAYGLYATGSHSAWAVTGSDYPFSFAALAEGDSVNAATLFTMGYHLGTDNLIADGSTENHVGFKITSGADTYYGYATFIVGPDSFAITSSHINDVPGAGITVGAIPEPSSAALILGVVAVSACTARRRRRQAVSN